MARKTTKKTGKKAAKAAAKTEKPGGPKKAAQARAPKPARTAGVPSLFRLNLEVGDLDQARQFYGKLLGLDGRLDRGSRVYFRCGPVTLQVVDVSASGTPHPAAKALYFAVADLDAVFARARELACLSRDVHGAAGGAISVRPWGERSFYAEDPWRNPLCFVEAGTEYTG